MSVNTGVYSSLFYTLLRLSLCYVDGTVHVLLRLVEYVTPTVDAVIQRRIWAVYAGFKTSYFFIPRQQLQIGWLTRVIPYLHVLRHFTLNDKGDGCTCPKTILSSPTFSLARKSPPKLHQEKHALGPSPSLLSENRDKLPWTRNITQHFQHGYGYVRVHVYHESYFTGVSSSLYPVTSTLRLSRGMGHESFPCGSLWGDVCSLIEGATWVFNACCLLVLKPSLRASVVGRPANVEIQHHLISFVWCIIYQPILLLYMAYPVVIQIVASGLHDREPNRQ